MASSFGTNIVLSLLPKGVADYVATYILHPRSSFQIYSREALTQAQRGYEALYPRLEPLYRQAIETVMSAEDFHDYVSMLPLILSAVAAIMIVSFAVRVVAWWTRLVTKLAMWAAILLILVAIWERGPFQSLKDLVAIAGALAGYGASVKDIWLSEYERYESQQAGGAGRGHSAGAGGRVHR